MEQVIECEYRKNFDEDEDYELSDLKELYFS